MRQWSSTDVTILRRIFFCFQFSENRAVKPHVVVPKDESDPPPSAHCYQFSPAPFIFHPAGCRSLNTATLSLSFGGGKKDTPEVKLEEGDQITLLTSPGPAAESSRKIWAEQKVKRLNFFTAPVLPGLPNRNLLTVIRASLEGGGGTAEKRPFVRACGVLDFITLNRY